MCDERRAKFTKTDFSGETPKQVSSFNLSNIMIYKSFIVLAITVIAATWGAGVIIANIMSSVAQVNFEHRVDAALEDDGDICRKIQQEIAREVEPNKDRLRRIENMLDPMYKKLTGDDPPPRIPEWVKQ